MQFDLKNLPEHRVGFWLPKDRSHITKWVNKLMEKARKKDINNIDPLLQAFKKVVTCDRYLNALSISMFNEVPNVSPYNTDPDGQAELKCFDDMLLAIDTILTTAPPWSDAAEISGLIGFPINAILDWPMATASGFAFFLEPKVNDCLKGILTKWCKYLQDVHQDSNLVLHPPSGWLGTDGLNALTAKGNQDGLSPAETHTFTQLYVCPNPDDPNTFGFESWDAFFTREFQDNVRPLDTKADIVHACESAPLQYPVSNVQLTDNFMGKNQAYSLQNMLDNDPFAEQFVGGTVYQAFLSALSYHKWVCPVDGTIVKITHVPGTYYSENMFQGFFGGKPDEAAPNNSQPYIASLATRALVFIQADNANIGLMCFIAIGMAEVSSCEVYVKEKQCVKKGDPLGTFHFGGSTHCLVFGPNVKLKWIGLPPKGDKRWQNMDNYHVKSGLANV
ncbi:14942_t:CDS:1 [Dentiscutata erythropus]|uniref:14942_t:CDS:1 n=1 Tax=Dentiscutata erythropus TaxID=1348616 RepID=A0A9N9JUG8_9GLOM|nr:14942_t:CDS:1 [Dentiscutata erythropus]